MALGLAEIKLITEIVGNLVTPIGLLIAGLWAYRRYVIEEIKYPHIETSAEIEFIGQKDAFWIVELRAVLENKGRAQHRFGDLNFELSSISRTDDIVEREQWGGQIDFPNAIKSANFLPKSYNFFFIGPSVTARYSYICRVPTDAEFLIFHCSFKYTDRKSIYHVMEKTVKVPSLSE